MRKSIIIIACFPFFMGCEQISKSIEETFQTNDSLVNTEAKNTEAKNTETKTETPPVDVQKLINEALEKHSAAINNTENTA